MLHILFYVLFIENHNVQVVGRSTSNSNPTYVENSTRFSIVYQVRPKDCILGYNYFTMISKLFLIL